MAALDDDPIDRAACIIKSLAVSASAEAGGTDVFGAMAIGWRGLGETHRCNGTGSFATVLGAGGPGAAAEDT